MLERNLRIGWLLMLGVSAVLLFAGEALFTLWLGPGNFVGYPILVAFLLTETLEAQSYIISCAARATGDEAFAWSYLLAGALKLGLSIFLAHHYGLLGVALGTVIALLLTNHWYVPWRGLHRLRYSRSLLLIRTIIPVAAWFAVTLALLAVCRPWFASDPLLNASMTIGIATAMVALAARFIVFNSRFS